MPVLYSRVSSNAQAIDIVHLFAKWHAPYPVTDEWGGTTATDYGVPLGARLDCLILAMFIVVYRDGARVCVR